MAPAGSPHNKVQGLNACIDDLSNKFGLRLAPANGDWAPAVADDSDEAKCLQRIRFLWWNGPNALFDCIREFGVLSQQTHPAHSLKILLDGQYKNVKRQIASHPSGNNGSSVYSRMPYSAATSFTSNSTSSSSVFSKTLNSASTSFTDPAIEQSHRTLIK